MLGYINILTSNFNWCFEMMFKKTLILGLGFRSFQPSTVFFLKELRREAMGWHSKKMQQLRRLQDLWDCCRFCFAWMVLPKSKRQKAPQNDSFQCRNLRSSRGEFPFQVPAVSFRSVCRVALIFFWFRSWNGCTRNFMPLLEARISEKEVVHLWVHLDTAWKGSSKQHLFHFFVISPSTRRWKKLQPMFVTSPKLPRRTWHFTTRSLVQHGTSFDNQDPGGKKGLETAWDLVKRFQKRCMNKCLLMFVEKSSRLLIGEICWNPKESFFWKDHPNISEPSPAWIHPVERSKMKQRSVRCMRLITTFVCEVFNINRFQKQLVPTWHNFIRENTITLLEPIFVWKLNLSISPLSTSQPLTSLPGQSHNGAAAVAEAFLSLKARIHKLLDQTAWKGEMEIYKSTSFAVEKNGSPLIPSFTITGDVFLRETCFVWQWRLVNLSDFAYHKCIHLNVDVEWSIWNTFEIAGIFGGGFFIATHIDWPHWFVSIHPPAHPNTSDGTRTQVPPRHHYSGGGRSFPQSPRVSWAEKKRLVPKRRVFDRCFCSICFTQAIFHHISANFAMKIFQKQAEDFWNTSLPFPSSVDLSKPLRSEAIEVYGGMCVLSSWMMNLEGGCSLWLFHGEKVE